MKQAVPERWSIPLPDEASPVIRIASPHDRPEPAPVAARASDRTGTLLVVGVAASAAVAGAAGAALLAITIGAPSGPGILAGAGEPLPAGQDAGVLADARPPLDGGGPAIVVDVAGAVMRPGIRTLRPGDRVGDAISAAGGFAPRADLAETARAVNLAEPLTDGMKVIVPELGLDPVGSRMPAGDPSRLDLNTADQGALEELPGIGPVTAQRIIEARSEQPFADVEDLRTRGVVGPSVFEDIRDLVDAGR